MATVLHPGRLSPARQVPAEITRPEYVGKKRPKTGEADVKTPEIIAKMRVERPREAMMRGTRAVAPGRPVNAVGGGIESDARRLGSGVVRDFTGHGIGRTFHSGLTVPHYDDPHTNVIMEQGMTFAIEPM